MRIGILTFHNAHNYGAVLQAYGLQEYLRSLGHHVSVVDYRNEYITSLYLRDSVRMWLSKNPFAMLKRLVLYVKYRKLRHARWDNFNRFINQRLNLFSYKNNDNLSYFDLIVIGSDQVWSASHTGGYDDIYFGKGISAKCITYAASMTSKILSRYDLSFFKEHINKLDAISVREDSIKHSLRTITEKKIEVVVDPTLLAGKKIFSNLGSSVPIKKRYILVYEIVPHDSVYEMARRIAKKENLELVFLTNGMLPFHYNDMHEEASPEEFVNYFKYAHAVITTSFHGTVFSLIFHRPLIAVRQGNHADNRIDNLLEKLYLSNLFVNQGYEGSIPSIDYNEVEKNIDKLCVKSINFLKESLSQ